MNEYIVFGILFLTIFLITLFLILSMRRVADPGIKRIKQYEKSRKSSRQKEKDKSVHEKQSGVNLKIGKVIGDFGRLLRQDEKKAGRFRGELIQAGYYREDAPKIFLGFKILSAILFFILFLYLGSLGNRSWSLVVFLSLIVSVVAYHLPDMILSFKIHKRQNIIAGGMPDALDLLVITVEAGLGLNAALLRVGGDLSIRCPPLAEEFLRITQDLRTGMSREEALRSFSNRNKIEDLKIFVGALVLADRLGTSIADTLRAQTDSLRTRIRQRAEEQAAKASIKMLLPLVLFILPALIIILMGPGLISVYRTFHP